MEKRMLISWRCFDYQFYLITQMYRVNYRLSTDSLECQKASSILDQNWEKLISILYEVHNLRPSVTATQVK